MTYGLGYYAISGSMRTRFEQETWISALQSARLFISVRLLSGSRTGVWPASSPLARVSKSQKLLIGLKPSIASGTEIFAVGRLPTSARLIAWMDHRSLISDSLSVSSKNGLRLPREGTGWAWRAKAGPRLKKGAITGIGFGYQYHPPVMSRSQEWVR